MADIFSQDSREKLEADLDSLTKKWHEYDGNYMRIYSTVAYAQVKELLDRQAAITERECGNEIANLRMMLEDTLESNDELRVKVDELTAETIEYDKALDAVKNDRDAWRERFEKANREKCDLQSSGVAQKFNNLCNRLRDKGITISWDDSRSDYWVSFPHDIETISAERDQWRDAAGNAHDMWEKVSAERDELKAENAKLSSDELHWRSEVEFWRCKYELIAKAVNDVARNYVDSRDEGMA